MWDIRQDDVSGSATRELIRLHLAAMHAHSPPGTVFALDLGGLTSSDVTVWTAWYGERIAGMGALKTLDDRVGELKSMRTHPDFIRRGVATVLLEHIIDFARTQGMARVSLETGTGPYFEPALALYRRRGFIDGAAFGHYRPGAFNQFLHLEL